MKIKFLILYTTITAFVFTTKMSSQSDEATLKTIYTTSLTNEKSYH